MIISIQTLHQYRSQKCPGWAFITLLWVAKLILALPLRDGEIVEGMQITLWSGKSKIKPSGRREAVDHTADFIEKRRM